jgi:hypothetical protein
MSQYTSYYLNSPSSVVKLETIEIAHPSFTATKWIVRNAVNGITATLEDGTTSIDFVYYPLKIDTAGVRDDLDQKITVQLGDLGDLLAAELDRITNANTFGTKPVLRYRTYRSDDLAHVLFGPVQLEIVSLAATFEGYAFDAQAPSLNANRTGEVYSMDRFPMLRGFL